MKLVECVPNFSEGRRPDVVAKIRDAIAAIEGIAILDVSSDQSHNRTVITFVAPVENAVDAAFAGIRTARDLIDLNHHTGEHPRMGATDVVPFIPLEGSTMEDCIVLAQQPRRARRPRSRDSSVSIRARRHRHQREKISPTSDAASSKAFAMR